MQARNITQPSIWAVIAIAIVSLTANHARAQSYLDRLEQLVKQLEQDTKPASSEELPAPSGTASPTPLVPTPMPANGRPNPPRSASSAQADSDQGGIYIGLEAEGYLDGRQGVKVTSVARNSPAWKGDLRVGDEIVALDGTPIQNLDDLGAKLSQKRANEVCNFMVTRNGRSAERSVVVMDAALAGQIMSRKPLRESGPAWLGVEANDLSRFFRTQFGLKIFAGAAVTAVTSNSPAKAAGMRPGDCIVEFQTTPIQSAEDLKRALNKSQPGDTVELTVYRGVIRKSVRLTLELDPTARDEVLPAVAAPRVAQPNSAQPTVAPALPTVAGPQQNQTEPPKRGAAALLDSLVPELLGPQRSGPSTAAPDANASSDKERIRQLEAEVKQLKSELSDATKQLNDTKNQLRSILQSLQQKLP